MNSRPLVLATTEIPEPYRSALESHYTLSFDPAARGGVRAIIAASSWVADSPTLESFPDLGLVCLIGSGYEGLDLTACRQRKVQVATSAGANAGAVAELALGLLLNLVRGIGPGERLLRAGQWRGASPRTLLNAPGLQGRRIGIVGMGGIGRAIAQRLEPFEVEIAYTGPRQKPDLTYAFVPSVIDLADWAEVLVLAHRADETNRGLVGADVFAALGPEGFLVNVSRGSAVDEDALIKAVESGGIQGAALDVFESEPEVRAELLNLPRTVMTPHIAGGSRPAFDRMYERVQQNLRAYFAGEPLPFGIAL